MNLLEEAIREEGLREKVQLVAIESEEEAQRHEFLGSPSIQIDGQDIEEARQKSPPFLAAGSTVEKTKKLAFRQEP